uniref:Small ribosomal subunit protein bS6 n=1 Tax=Candidatus Phytoplasma australasiaticum subsp. australasiaticum TaxID=2832407 RepID=A0A7S7JMI8_9MOLU|nr:30S ribosomal protein S6 ['Parthenium hysterophorus' phyllody phytoplasma]
MNVHYKTQYKSRTSARNSRKFKKTFIKNKDINCFEEIIPASIELKELAYPIKKFQQGYYVQSTIKADNTFVEKFNQLMQITEEILRFLIIKK